MKYSTQHHYSVEILEEVTNFCLFWDQHQNRRTKRIEKVLTTERNLYLQYMFINYAPSPLSPSKELVERWLAPAKEFEIYNIRLEILRRLFEFTKNDLFNYPFKKIHFPNFFELIFWRKYHTKIYNQTRTIFNQITSSNIIDAELATCPFYDFMRMYRLRSRSNESSADFFLDSHELVSNMLLNNLDQMKGLKILDIGCGDGRLLLHIRAKFPMAHLYASNFFESTGVNPKLLADTNFTLKVCALEDMDFDENFFDAIVSTEVIEHLKSPSEMVLKIKKHLKKDGFFIVTAPSLHTRFLSLNPITYLAGLISTLYEDFLPPFHNLYEGLTDLPLVHYAFSHQEFQRMFKLHFTNTTVSTSRFTHLRKFKLHNLAHRIPFLSLFGGLVIASGKKSD